MMDLYYSEIFDNFKINFMFGFFIFLGDEQWELGKECYLKLVIYYELKWLSIL